MVSKITPKAEATTPFKV